MKNPRNKVRIDDTIKIPLDHNPSIYLKNTRVVNSEDTKFITNARIMLDIEGIRYTPDGKILLPDNWSIEKMTDRITRNLVNHTKRVLEGFEKTPEVKAKMSNSYHELKVEEGSEYLTYIISLPNAALLIQGLKTRLSGLDPASGVTAQQVPIELIEGEDNLHDYPRNLYYLIELYKPYLYASGYKNDGGIPTWKYSPLIRDLMDIKGIRMRGPLVGDIEILLKNSSDEIRERCRFEDYSDEHIKT